MALWMMYAAVVGVLVAAAARAAEAWASWRGRPRRWAWACALTVALVLPAAALLRAESGPVTVLTERVDVAGTMAGATWDAPEREAVVAWRAALARGVAGGRAALERSGRAAGVVWGLLSGALLLWLAAGAVRLRRLRTGWSPAVVDGVSVLLSRDIGPAVVGVAGARIVAPDWITELPPEARLLLLAHEEEHLRARDPLLLSAALAAVVAQPWNPAVWWLHRRLRLAVELDCDARVLRRHPDATRYGATLLEVGRRRGRLPLPAAAFAAPPRALEQRMRALLSPPRSGGMRALGVPLALAALVAAWALPAPALQRTPGGVLTRAGTIGEVPGQHTARFNYTARAGAAPVAGPRSTLRRASLPPGDVVVGSGPDAEVVFFAVQVAPDGSAPGRIPGSAAGRALALDAARAAAGPDRGAGAGAGAGSRGAADAATLTTLAGTLDGGPVRWFVADAEGTVMARGAGVREDALRAFAGLGPLAVVQAVGGEHLDAGAGVTVLFARLR